MAGEIGHWCGIDLIGGGLGAVDKIDGAVLQDKEGFLVVTPTQFAPLSLDADSGLGENSPQRIAPNTNPGDKRWILVGGVFAGLTLYGNVVMPDGGTIGQAAGPLLTFDDTNNFLEITGCRVGLGTSTPGQVLDLRSLPTVLGNARINAFIFDDTAMAAGVGGGLVFGGKYNAAGTQTTFAGIWAEKENGDEANFAGELHLGTRVAAGSISSDVIIDSLGNVDVNGELNTTDFYKVDDTQVVSNQGAVVADATDPATTMARLNDLLARCRAHGLIAT